MESRGQADRDVEGHVVRLTGLDLDITERRRTEEVLQARREEERDRALHKQAEEALRRSHAELEQQTLQLRRLASQLTLAEQTARKQLASMLHDGLQQSLFSAGGDARPGDENRLSRRSRQLLHRVRADIKEAMEAARTLSVNLFPPVFHVGGLPAGLEWLAKRTNEQYNVAVNVTADPRPTRRQVIFASCSMRQSASFCSMQSSTPMSIGSISSSHSGPVTPFQIQVSDEGVGFDPKAYSPSQGPTPGRVWGCSASRSALLCSVVIWTSRARRGGEPGSPDSTAHWPAASDDRRCRSTTP